MSGVNALAVSSEAEESPIVADVPVEEDKPFGETLPPEVLAQMREEALKMAAEMQIIPASPMALGYSLRRPTISAKTALTMLFLAVRDSILLTLMPQLLGNLHPNRCVLFVGGAGL